MTTASTTTVNGFVAPGFEKVREAVEALPAPWGRGGGGIAAYAGGKLVVDLWGGAARPGQPWREDTLAPVASVTKSWAGVVVGRLVEQGVLDYRTTVATWWPEFAAHGKQGITLHDLFMHSSGVLGFDGQVDFLDANDNAGWHDLDGIAARLADAKPSWTPGTRNGYHAVSYGWLLNEVVRRTTGRTIGDLFHTDVALPLGLDTHLGTSADDFARVARVIVADPTKGPWLMRKLMSSATKKGSNLETLFGRALLGDGRSTILDRVEGYCASPSWMASEVPASNGTTTPRSLARLFAALAAGGTLDGVTILKPETVAQMRQIHGEVKDVVMTEPLPAILRGVLPKARTTYSLFPNPVLRGKLQAGPNPKAFVSGGFGGQLVMGDSDANLAFSSTGTDFTPGRDAAIQEPALAALYACL